MKIITIKKIFSLFTVLFISSVLITPVFAQGTECADQDGDGYITLSERVMDDIMPGFDENGSYSAAQWQDYFYAYKNSDLRDPDGCPGLNFKKGAEPTRCDSSSIGPNSNVYDPAKVTTPLRGSQVNPGAYDSPDNGIDENCDGQDAGLLGGSAVAPGGQKDVGGLVQRVITLLSRIVVAVSVIIMIWGGVLYATAAGDEQKTSKARKAIIGAVIGLVIGLLAPTIVNMIVGSIG